MFDLNVDVVVSVDDSDHSNRDRIDFETKKNVLEDRQSEIHSGTSVSSDVLNAEEDSPIINDADANDEDSVSFTAYSNINNRSDRFGILSRSGELKEISNVTSVGLITRQFFPVESDLELEEDEELGSRSVPSSPLATSLLRSQWLNLKVPESVQAPQKLPVPSSQPAKKSRRGPRSRSSQYRGVTFYRRTGWWESHIWDCGKQVYLGGFDTALAAARAYDRAAIKFRGIDADINFHINEYNEDMIQTKNLSKEEFIHILRRQSTGFSRGSSKYRGVTLHKCGRWEARMGQLLGKKAYDKAAIKCNGREAVTNFEPSIYGEDINVEAMDEASGHNLDLNLWVSPTMDIPPKEDHNFQNMDMRFTACELPSVKRSKVQTLDPASMGGKTPVSKHFPVWPSMFSGFTPNNEEIAIGNGSASVRPPPGHANTAWQMQLLRGHGVALAVPVSSTAASSGFSSSSITMPTAMGTSSLYFTNQIG